MKYYYLEPEVAGGYGEDTVLDTSVRPERVERLHYEFQGWLGDDLLEAFPVFIISERLKNILQPLHATGYELDHVKVSKEPQFRELYPNAPPLPKFHWLKISGRGGWKIWLGTGSQTGCVRTRFAGVAVCKLESLRHRRVPIA